MSRRLSAFRERCANASDNQLIKIALDEAQEVGYNENSDVHSRCLQIATEELERRGLDVSGLDGAHGDTDFDNAA